jgi:hypothetical protein
MFQHNVRVNWIKIKVLKVDKEAENTIKYKYNKRRRRLHENQHGGTKLKRGERRNGQQTILWQTYMDKHSISIDKKADLLSLCNSLVIQHKFIDHFIINCRPVKS